MIDLFAEFTVIVRGFNRRRIPCAVIGGVALAVYARPRFTDDIDFLADEQRFPVAQRVLEDLRYDETAQPGTFRDSGATQHRFMKVAGRDSLVVDVQTGGSRCGGILRRSLRVRWS